MSKRGVFITLEGPEGSGKSSQAKRLASSLRRGGSRVALFRDPGSTALGRQLRTFLLHSRGELSALFEALLFIGGRVALVEERIRPALAAGQVVLCDRFHDSTVAYQGFGGTLDWRWLDRWGRRAVGGTMPALTVLLDLPTRAGFARIRRRHDRMERKARRFHQRVRDGFRQLARREPGRIAVVDAARAPGEVARAVRELVATALGRAG